MSADREDGKNILLMSVNNSIKSCYVEKEVFLSVLEEKFSSIQSYEKSFYYCEIEYDIVKSKIFDPKMKQLLENIFHKVLLMHLLVGKDLFTIDGSKFLILSFIPDEKKIMDIVNHIAISIYNKFKDNVSLDYSYIKYPFETADYSELHYILDKKKVTYQINDSLNYSFTNDEDEQTFFNKDESDLFEAIHTLLQRLKVHDKYLLKHSLAVAQCVIYFAQELSLPKIGQKNLIIASLIHDVGYLNINIDRDNSGKLTTEEWMQVKCHPYIATNVILPPFPVFNDCLDIIKDHHEYIDGSGYPLGKKSTDISIYSQVLSIADTYTAIREDRPHRRALRFDEIIDIFIKSAGIKWNETLVTMFLATIADTEFRHKINDPNFDAITQFIDNIIQY